MDPVRTCVGCRQRDSFKNLYRVVVELGNYRVSESSNGRGAWVHYDCLQKAIERKGFHRALGAAEMTELETWHRNQAEKNAGNQMSNSK
jgi:uncharacterized protein